MVGTEEPRAIGAPSAYGARPRIESLDGLRGIAVMLVVCSHTSNVGWHVVPWLDMSGTGKVGVWLFFVLSAFLLTSQLNALAAENRFDRVALSRYAIARFFRIAPLYICILAWDVITARMSAADGLLHAALQKGVGIYWTIPVEIKYYAALPVVIAVYNWICRRDFTAFGVVLTVVAALCLWFAPPSGTLVNSIELGPYLPVFLIGSFAALAVAKAERRAVPSWLTALAILALVLTVPSVMDFLMRQWTTFKVAPDEFHPYSPLYAALWIVVLTKTLQSEAWTRFLASRPLRIAGRISFSLYLVHVPAMEILAPLTWLPPSAKGSATVLAAAVIAAATFALIEYPGIQLGRALNLARRPG